MPLDTHDRMTNEPRPPIREMQPEIRETPGAATREAPMPAQFMGTAWLRFALLATLPGIVLAVLGPFGSYEAPLGMRFAYWVPTMMAGAFTGAIAGAALDRIKFFHNRPVPTLAALSTAVTAVMTLVAWLAAQLVFGTYATTLSPVFVLYVWIITLAMTAIASLVMERNKRVAAASAPVQVLGTTIAPTLDARLPAKIKGGCIFALEAEDHYVRVHTELGSGLILMRLSDAASEMGLTPGARTHRSWWVAKSAVRSVERSDGKLSLRLDNGLEVPVSRGYASELKQAGWLTN